MRLYSHRTEEEAQEAVDLVQHIARVPKGAKVLDLACGYGRHAMALAEAGYNVHGLDASNYLIERAKEVYAHDRATYVVGDMRGPYPEDGFDAIVNFFTSFGYFDDHEENQKVLNSVKEHLRPGGRFIMDYLNAAPMCRKTLEPETMSRVQGALVIQERESSRAVRCEDHYDQHRLFARRRV